MKTNLVALLALLADVAASIAVWPRLPERVPVHWGLSGAPDRFGSRWELLLLGPGLLLGLWLVLSLVSRIDPKAAVPLPADAPPAEAGTRDAVVAVVLALLALFHVAVLLQASGQLVDGPLLFALLLAAFQLLLGNFMPRVRPNFFVGVRTPWTLSSDPVWRRTHRLAGKLLFAGGFLSAAAGAALAPQGALVASGALLAAALVLPAVLSYVWWRQEQVEARAAGGSRKR